MCVLLSPGTWRSWSRQQREYWENHRAWSGPEGKQAWKGGSRLPSRSQKPETLRSRCRLASEVTPMPTQHWLPSGIVKEAEVCFDQGYSVTSHKPRSLWILPPETCLVTELTHFERNGEEQEVCLEFFWPVPALPDGPRLWGILPGQRPLLIRRKIQLLTCLG